MTLSSCSSSLRLNFISLVRDIIAHREGCGSCRFQSECIFHCRAKGLGALDGWLTHFKRSPNEQQHSPCLVNESRRCLCCFYRKLILPCSRRLRFSPFSLSPHVRVRLSRDEGMLSGEGKVSYNFRISRARNAYAGFSGVERGEKRIVNQFVAGKREIRARSESYRKWGEHKFTHGEGSVSRRNELLSTTRGWLEPDCISEPIFGTLPSPSWI